MHLTVNAGPVANAGDDRSGVEVSETVTCQRESQRQQRARGRSASVFVPEGQIGANFTVTSGVEAGSVIVTGSAAGLMDGSSNVFVYLREFSLSSPLVGIERTVTATINLAQPAPVSGARNS